MVPQRDFDRIKTTPPKKGNAMIDYKNLTEDQADFFYADGGRDDWTDEQKEEFWKDIDQIDIDIARLHGF